VGLFFLGKKALNYSRDHVEKSHEPLIVMIINRRKANHGFHLQLERSPVQPAIRAFAHPLRGSRIADRRSNLIHVFTVDKFSRRVSAIARIVVLRAEQDNNIIHAAGLFHKRTGFLFFGEMSFIIKWVFICHMGNRQNCLLLNRLDGAMVLKTSFL